MAAAVARQEDHAASVRGGPRSRRRTDRRTASSPSPSGDPRGPPSRRGRCRRSLPPRPVRHPGPPLPFTRRASSSPPKVRSAPAAVIRTRREAPRQIRRAVEEHLDVVVGEPGEEPGLAIPRLEHEHRVPPADEPRPEGQALLAAERADPRAPLADHRRRHVISPAPPPRSPSGPSRRRRGATRAAAPRPRVASPRSRRRSRRGGPR